MLGMIECCLGWEICWVFFFLFVSEVEKLTYCVLKYNEELF